jgi:WD40 repeat protein
MAAYRVWILTGLALAAGAAAAPGLLARQQAPPPRGDGPAEGKPAPAPEARTDALGDPLPEGALLRIGTVRYRAGANINSAALSPDGKVLATVSQSGLTFWELATGRPLARVRDAGVSNALDTNQSLLCFTPDGKRLVGLAGGFDVRGGVARPVEDAIVFWDAASGKEVRRLPVSDKPGGPVVIGMSINRSVWLAAGGKEVGHRNPQGEVSILDAVTGKRLRHFATTSPDVVASPDGKHLAVAEPNNGTNTLLCDAATGKEVRRWPAPGRPDTMGFSGDGALLAVVDPESNVRVYEVATGRERWSVQTPPPKGPGLHFYISALAFTPDNKTLIAGTTRGEILRWDAASGAPQPPLTGHAGVVSRVIVTPDGRLAVSVGWDGEIRRWDLPSGGELPGPEGFRKHVCAALTPDGRRVAAADMAGRLELYDAATGRRSAVWQKSGPGVVALQWSPDGTRLAAAREDDAVGLWDAGGRERRMLRLPGLPKVRQQGDNMFAGLAFAPDGKTLLTSHQADGTRLWDAASGETRWHDPGAARVAFAPDGRTVASAWYEGQLRLRDAATGKDRQAPAAAAAAGAVPGRMMPIYNLAYAPDGSYLATCEGDGSLRLRDAAGWPRRAVRGESRLFMTAAFSPDGRWVAAGGYDRGLWVWEAATGGEVRRFEGHEGAVQGLEFTPDGSALLTWGADKTVLLWDLRPSRAARPAGGFAALWEELASADAARAYRAVWALRDDPKAAVALLRAKLPPADVRVDEAQVRKLLADLDSERFAAREAAARALAKLGPPATPALRQALAGAGSTELQRSLRRILDGLKADPGREDFRRMRAVQALELASTPEAREVLRAWAGGTAEMPLTEDARAALLRLEKRSRLRDLGS